MTDYVYVDLKSGLRFVLDDVDPGHHGLGVEELVPGLRVRGEHYGGGGGGVWGGAGGGGWRRRSGCVNTWSPRAGHILPSGGHGGALVLAVVGEVGLELAAVAQRLLITEHFCLTDLFIVLWCQVVVVVVVAVVVVVFVGCRKYCCWLPEL